MKRYKCANWKDAAAYVFHRNIGSEATKLKIGARFVNRGITPIADATDARKTAE